MKTKTYTLTKEIDPREVPQGCPPLPEDLPSLAYVPKELHKEFEFAQDWIYSSYKTDWLFGYSMDSDILHYAIDTSHPEAKEYFPQICEAMQPDYVDNDWVVYVGEIKGICKQGNLYQIGQYRNGIIYPKNQNGTCLVAMSADNFRHATDEEIEVHLRSLLPDWLQVGKRVRVLDNDRVITVTNISLYVKGHSARNVEDYSRKHGKCLKIKCGIYALPFGVVWDEELCNYQPVKERYVLDEDDLMIYDNETKTTLSIADAIKLLNETN